jgi:hypothetical protein
MDSTVFDSIFTEDLYQFTPKVTLVITQAWNELTTEDKIQLTKITETLRQRIDPKLNLQAFRVVAAPSLDLSTWPEKPERLIYFGPPVKGLSYYEMIEVNNTRMVLSEALRDLAPNEAARGKLWVALKQLFAS